MKSQFGTESKLLDFCSVSLFFFSPSEVINLVHSDLIPITYKEKESKAARIPLFLHQINILIFEYVLILSAKTTTYINIITGQTMTVKNYILLHLSDISHSRPHY